MGKETKPGIGSLAVRAAPLLLATSAATGSAVLQIISRLAGGDEMQMKKQHAAGLERIGAWVSYLGQLGVCRLKREVRK